MAEVGLSYQLRGRGRAVILKTEETASPGLLAVGRGAVIFITEMAGVMAGLFYFYFFIIFLGGRG